MFDYLCYENRKYQTKDTPSQSLDDYKIERDQDSGHQYLWHQEYDMKWVKNDSNFFGSSLETSNHRWVQCSDFDGNIRFYRTEDKGKTSIEYSALFMDGQLLRIKKIDNVD